MKPLKGKVLISMGSRGIWRRGGDRTRGGDGSGAQEPEPVGDFQDDSAKEEWIKRVVRIPLLQEKEGEATFCENSSDWKVVFIILLVENF